MRIELVVAVARNGVIGARGSLPWRLPDDLRRFRAITTGHAVVMGRKTWESLRGALPDRQNIVVTRQRTYRAAGAQVVDSFDAALEAVSRPEPAFCIGGGELFREALPRSSTIHLTRIDRDFEGDATFPALGPAQWRVTQREDHRTDGDDGFGYTFMTYTRVG